MYDRHNRGYNTGGGILALPSVPLRRADRAMQEGLLVLNLEASAAAAAVRSRLIVTAKPAPAVNRAISNRR
jgi:hypothetical protein